MNKTTKTLTIILFVGLLVGLVFGESLQRGLTWLKDKDNTIIETSYVTTDAASDSLYTLWYLTDDVGYFNSIRVVVDSVNGACSLLIELQESYDGVSVEFTTQLYYDNFAQARLDTVLELNLYPLPYTRVLFAECDAGSGESLAIDTATVFSHD